MNTLLLRGCTKLFHLYVTRVTQRMRSENCNWYLSDFYAVATRQTTLCRTSKIAVGADHVAQKYTNMNSLSTAQHLDCKNQH